MGTTYYAVMGGSRILNASRVDQSGADDVDVIGWDKSNAFILAVNINSGSKDTIAAQYKLRWRDVTDSGTFSDVAATGEVKFGATDLVNGDPILVGGRKCDSQGGDTWQAGEEVEGAANSDSIDLADEYETEIHFSLSVADGDDGHEYELELYDDTNGASKGTCGASLTIAAGAVIQAVAADGIKAADSALRSKIISAIASDGIKGGDSPGNTASLQALLADGAEFGDLASVIAKLQGLSVDGAEFGDVTEGVVKKIVTAIDGILLSDITNNIAKLRATSADGITLTDIAEVVKRTLAGVSDGITLIDISDVVKTTQATTLDGVKFSDVSIGAVLGAIVAIVSDGVVFSDAAISRANYLAQASDGVVFSEVVSGFLKKIATASDGITFTDSATAAITGAIQALAADGIKLSDNASAALTLLALAADSIILTDTGIPQATFRVTTADGVKFSEAINTIFHFVATVTDGFTVSDTAIEVSVTASGNVKICITSKSSRILFTVMKPSVSIEPKAARINIIKTNKDIC